MRLIKLGLGNVNTTVGATRSNTDAMLRCARAMAADGVAVGCFSEQVIGGYPPEDLIQWRAFVADQRRQLERFAVETADTETDPPSNEKDPEWKPGEDPLPGPQQA